MLDVIRVKMVSLKSYSLGAVRMTNMIINLVGKAESCEKASPSVGHGRRAFRTRTVICDWVMDVIILRNPSHRHL